MTTFPTEDFRDFVEGDGPHYEATATDILAQAKKNQEFWWRLPPEFRASQLEQARQRNWRFGRHPSFLPLDEDPK